jgi:PAS domain-containing protein
MTPPAFNGYTNQKQNQQKQNSKQMSRNEREQQRAAKISGVIDKLRNTMVQGGWKVEMKSKYQVLSTSAEYLRQLIQVTQEQESELVKTKEEFAIRNQKLDEDRALQDGSTDDSLTSSLTQSFTGTHSVDERWKGKFGNGDSSTDVAVASVSPGRDSSKRKMPNEWSDEGEIASKKEKNGDDDSNHGSNSSGNFDSNNIISVHKMSSSLSDVTDSNRCSSDGQGTNGSSDGQGGAGGKEIKASFDLSVLAMAESDTSKTAENSVSTTGAVVSGEDELSGEHKHTSIVFTKDRKRTYSEKTSMDEDFHLSYQEIFLASNVPQLIATPSGRIVACNDFFFRVTGLTEKDVKKVTIFSMVQVDHLSALFELVAEALRTSNTHNVSNTSSNESSSKPSSITDSNLTSNCASSNDNSQDTRDKNSDSGTEEKEPSIEPLQFETVTLPCVSFPNVLNNEKDGRLKNLYMNVTFMYDVNPLKRCIHCALTDQPGARGKIGNITPELLTMVFPSDS